MNKLIFPNGGMPFELDDLDFMQQATKEAMLGCVHEFARQESGNIILSGLEVTGASAPYDVSEGYVMLNYEVCYFPAQTSTDAIPYIGLDDTYDAAGSDIFYDGVTRDTYNVRRGKVVPSGTPSSFLHDDSKKLTTIMKNLIVNPTEIVEADADGIVYVFQAGDLPTDVTFNGTDYPYAIKKNGRVCLYGTVILGATLQGVAGVNVLALPASMVPTGTSPVSITRTYVTNVSSGLVQADVSLTHIRQSLILNAVGTMSIFHLSGICYDLNS